VPLMSCLLGEPIYATCSNKCAMPDGMDVVNIQRTYKLVH
jgi:hypothetical protein